MKWDRVFKEMSGYIYELTYPTIAELQNQKTFLTYKPNISTVFHKFTELNQIKDYLSGSEVIEN